jgi:hypothetical protein
VSTSRDTDVFWLDLSQVQINSYFNQLFALHDRIQHRLGRWEVTLSLSHALSVDILDRTPTIDLLLDLIGSMHVTNPPCKTLGIYHVDGGFEPYPSYNKLVHRVHNDSGIRIAELVSALKGCTSTVVSSWKLRVEELRTRVTRSHWIDDIWTVPAAPTIVICMDNHEMPDDEVDYDSITGSRYPQYGDQRRAAATRMGYGAHITRVPYLAARPFRASREGEWIPKELFEPLKSETGRSPINYDT